MISRCVVESGTSSYYSAIRDATDEPVLKEIAGRIAADEYRHYKLFYEILNVQDEPDLPFWKKLIVAVGRINESDDDELAYAFYCAHVPADQATMHPYNRADCAKSSYKTILRIYRRQHVQRLAQMVSKAVGADPQGRLTKAAGAIAVADAALPCRTVRRSGRDGGLNASLHQHLLDLADGAGRIEALGAGLRAVHDRVAAIEAERVLEIVEAFARAFVAGIDQPAIGLQQRRGTEIALRIPPVARA